MHARTRTYARTITKTTTIGNSINPPGRELPPVSATYQFALDYLQYLKTKAHINAVRIGDGPGTSNELWYNAADEIGMLIYAGPYSSPKCHGCGGKPFKGLVKEKTSHPTGI